MDPKELAEMKAKILTLEEQKDELIKKLDSRADKAEIKAQLDGIIVEQKQLREDFKTASKLPTTTQNEEESFAAGFWS